MDEFPLFKAINSNEPMHFAQSFFLYLPIFLLMLNHLLIHLFFSCIFFCILQTIIALVEKQAIDRAFYHLLHYYRQGQVKHSLFATHILRLVNVNQTKHSYLLDFFYWTSKHLLLLSTLVLGLGVSGKLAARLALARGASVLVIDKNEQLVPLEHENEFAEYANLQTMLGDFDIAQLENSDRIVVSPGIPLEEYALSSLMKSGVTVMPELDFAAEVLPKSVKVLAVTGTNGKSTVTSFAGQMLDHLGIKAFVGGNLGKPLSEAAISYLNSSSVEDIYQVVVVEVSSYQMDIPNKFFSPSVSVILNLTPDHLERHRTMENYAVIKCRLLSHMKHDKLALLPIGNPYLNKAFCDQARGCNLTWIGDFPGLKMDMETKVASFEIPTAGLVAHLQLGALRAMGAHNYTNAAVAAFLVLGLDIGIDYHSINSIVGKLTLPPHRMQVVCTDAHGVKWVDDSKATNIESTYTGLMGLKGHKLIVLLGGLAKALSSNGPNGFERLVELLKHHRSVITFGSSGEMIYSALCGGGLSIPCIKAKNLEEAVKFAKNIAVQGDTVLLSPGCASFDEFKNFEHRGQVFQELVFFS